MKRTFSITSRIILSVCLVICTFTVSFAQQGFTYQGIARNQDGIPLANQGLTVRVAIMAEDGGAQIIWQEEHEVTTNQFGLFTFLVGDPAVSKQAGTASSFDMIDWSAMPYSLKVWISSNGGAFTEMGESPIRTVPMAQYAVSARSANSNFSVQPSAEGQPGEALFEVRRKDGQPVFAVYEDMVWVYVDSTESKGAKGGFAVGGYSRTKGVTEEYMRVTSDSVRVYVKDDPTKGAKGGFAVGGYNRTKQGNAQEFLHVSPDSVRVYIDSDPGTKGAKGGFAVGGYSRTKSSTEDLIFNLSPKQNAEVITDKSQILFYPSKDAFIAGTIHVGSADSVGQNSTALGFESIAMGQYSQGFGFRSKALGDYSTAIGREAVSNVNSFALGNSSKALGNDSYAFGSGAEASGAKSFAFGSVGIDTAGNVTGVPTSASGDYAIAFGMGARATNSGAMSFGPSSVAEGFQSVAIGSGTTASGSYATGIGYRSRALGYKSIAIGAHYSYSLFFPDFGGKGGTSVSSGFPEEAKGSIYPIYKIPIYIYKPRTVTAYNQAIGDYSISLGNGNYSSDGGFALGTYNKAYNQGSVAFGVSNIAYKAYSFAAGYNNEAQGYYSVAFGDNVTSQAMNSFVIGKYNVLTGDTAEWIPADPLFQIGNGSSSSDRHDAFRVYKNGATYIYPQSSAYGMYVYGTNSYINTYNYSRIDADNSYSTVYGLYNYVYSTDNSITTIYSGRFAGTVSAGNYQGLYADLRTGDAIDVAEYINDSNGDTEAGDVLVADPDRNESVMKSSHPYQTSVVGVVTTKPHMVMGMELVVDEETGEALEGVSATRLALTGRVPVRVTDENGPIVPGDLLTSSSTPGCAMKWSLLDVNSAKDFDDLKRILAENEQRRNAVIGKALGSSESGEGTVMVLISVH